MKVYWRIGWCSSIGDWQDGCWDVWVKAGISCLSQLLQKGCQDYQQGIGWRNVREVLSSGEKMEWAKAASSTAAMVCAGIFLSYKQWLNLADLGCSRSMVVPHFESFLRTCSVNMGCTLPFWWDIVMQMESPQSCCKYWVLSSHIETIYRTAMISMMSWEEHHSKHVTKTGQRTHWSKI